MSTLRNECSLDRDWLFTGRDWLFTGHDWLFTGVRLVIYRSMTGYCGLYIDDNMML